MKTVIVTGGAGFIGSHVVERLLNIGYGVISIDKRLEGGMYVNDNNVRYLKEQTTAAPIPKWIMGLGVEAIIHLGAWSNVRESMDRPLQLYENNVMATAHIIDALIYAYMGKKAHVKSVVFASSSAVVNPESHYGVSKLASEKMLDVFREQMKGVTTVANLRFGNVYGPRQNPKNGTLIAKLIEHILEDTSPTIYGDGSQMRDYIYVKDVVDVIILCMEKGLSDTMNCSTGSSWSVNEIYSKTKEALHESPIMRELRQPEYVERRAGDKDRVDMPTSLWMPMTPLVDGILEQLNWANSMEGTWNDNHYIDGTVVK